MTAQTTIHAAGITGLPDAEVARLAGRAIAIVLSEKGVRQNSMDAMETQLELLGDAFLSDRDETRHAVLARMRQGGVPAEDIIDIVLPQIARSAGQRWMADDISFAEVTIVTARLQETVRALGRGSRGGPSPRREDGDRPVRERGSPAQPRVLLIIPRVEDHTLGTFVVADQMRRLGSKVDIAMDMHPRQIAEKVRKSRYHMIGITAAGRRTLASTKELVETIKASVTRVTPVVLGGSVVEGGGNLKAMTGVDHVVRDVPSALKACGLMKQNEDVVPGAPGESLQARVRPLGNTV
jgi:MerR family transcriptional regulator, light-induced transcriptional regulator